MLCSQSGNIDEWAEHMSASSDERAGGDRDNGILSAEPIPSGSRGLHALLVNQIGTLIIKGELRADENLPPEEELSQQFGVSRTVIREAMRVLAAKGLVESRPKTGTRVLPRKSWSLLDPAILRWQQDAGPTRQFLEEFEEVRVVLEPEAARLAASRGSEQQVQDVVAACASMAEAVESDDGPAFIEADVAFHSSIFAASANQLLRQMGNAVTTLLEIRHAGHDRIPGDRAATLPEHERVVDAIRDRDPVRAHDAMVALIERAAADDTYVAVPDSEPS